MAHLRVGEGVGWETIGGEGGVGGPVSELPQRACAVRKHGCGQGRSAVVSEANAGAMPLPLHSSYSCRGVGCSSGASTI